MATARTASCAALIAAGGIAAYLDSFRAPFVYDDVYSIAQNPSIRRLADLGAVLRAPADAATAQGRPVLNLSLALNYAWGGLSPAGYHAANLAIHILAGLALFGIVRRTLLQPRLRARFGAASTGLALAAAVLWTAHPLQTEAITYTSQRAESLMGLFYLLTVYTAIRATGAPRPGGWWAACVGACLLGMGTKEVMASAPVLVLLYDRTFVAGSFREAWRRHGRWLLALAATWLPLAGLIAAGGGNRGGAIGFGVGIPWWAYARTQGEAVLRYLWLSFWPHPLAFDYGTVWAHGPAALLAVAAVLLLAAAAGAAVWRAPALGFPALWFFAILAPTSLVPGTTQMIVEHRMYLALAPVVALAVAGVHAALSRRSLRAAAALAALALTALTARRNRDYRSAETLWADTVLKRPQSAAAHYNLGFAIETDPARADEAIAQFRAALRLDPFNADAHDSLGLLLGGRPGGRAEALRELQTAVRLSPNDPKARNNLGNLLIEVPGRLSDAIAELKVAERLQPSNADIHDNLARAYNDFGVQLAADPANLNEAVAAFRKALQENPSQAQIQDNLNVVLARLAARTGAGSGP